METLKLCRLHKARCCCLGCIPGLEAEVSTEPPTMLPLVLFKGVFMASGPSRYLLRSSNASSRMEVRQLLSALLSGDHSHPVLHLKVAQAERLGTDPLYEISKS